MIVGIDRCLWVLAVIAMRVEGRRWSYRGHCSDRLVGRSTDDHARRYVGYLRGLAIWHRREINVQKPSEPRLVVVVGCTVMQTIGVAQTSERGPL